MELTNSIARTHVLRWARQIQARLESGGDTEAANAVKQAIEQLLADRFTLTIVGKAKRGKSTLINALLGRTDDTVAPIDKLPASSVITRFFRDDQESAVVHLRDGQEQSIGFSAIRNYVTEEGNPQNAKGVAFVDVSGPFASLDPHVVLVDTPGAGSLHLHHDTMLHAFLPMSDAVIFLVTSRDPLDQEEVDLLKQLKSTDIRKILFAVNKTDASTPQDLADGMEHNLKILQANGIGVSKMHAISAKRAYTGDLAGSGLAALAAEITEVLEKFRGQAQLEQFVKRVQAFAGPMLQRSRLQLEHAATSDTAIEQQLLELEKTRGELSDKLTTPTREFVRDWKEAVDDFDRQLEAVRVSTKQAMVRTVENTAVFDIRKMLDFTPAKALAGAASAARQAPGLLSAANARERLPVLITAEFEKKLEPASIALRQRLQELVGSYGQQLPSLQMGIGDRATLSGSGIDPMKKAAKTLGVGVAGSTILSVGASALATHIAASVTAATLNPLTWLPAFGGGAASFAASGALAVVAGPVAMAVLAVGVAAAPIAFYKTLQKNKDSLPSAVRQYVDDLVDQLRAGRLTELRGMGDILVREVRKRSEADLAQVEASLKQTRQNRPSPAQLLSMQDSYRQWEELLASQKLLSAGTAEDA